MSLKDPKISISVPIHNRELYIKQCAESLLAQTYNNIEYIFIDDASTDNSINVLHQVIEKYPNRKESIKLICLPTNKGLWNARNIGIAESTGDYVMACDADDWIDLDGVERLVNILYETDADVITSPFYIESKNRTISNIDSSKVTNINSVPIDVNYYSVCNKIIRHSIYTEFGLKVPNGVNCWEDLSITSRILTLTDKVGYMHRPFYHYRCESQKSLSHINHKKILHDHLICTEFLIQWFSNKGPEFYSQYSGFITTLKFSAKIKMLRGEYRDFESWKRTYPEVNKCIHKLPWLALYYKILFITVALLPVSICKIIDNIYNVTTRLLKG